MPSPISLLAEPIKCNFILLYYQTDWKALNKKKGDVYPHLKRLAGSLYYQYERPQLNHSKAALNQSPTTNLDGTKAEP